MTMTALVRRLMVGPAFAAALPLAACSVDVREQEFGDRKDVEIHTPAGAMSVRTGVSVDTGLAVYPGARPLRGSEPESADVTIGSAMFGVKVIATRFEADADPDDVLGFYREQMKGYGEVVECRGDIDFRGRLGSQRPICKRRPFSRQTQLVVGTEEQHRLVSVTPRGGGSEFAVVYLQTRS